MLFVSKNCSLEKVAFMNSSCFIIFDLNWIVFMAIVKHFRVKMRLAFLCCANCFNDPNSLMIDDFLLEYNSW